MKIEYIHKVSVFLDGSYIGDIKSVRHDPLIDGHGYAYYPRGGGMGEIFKTIEEVKKSLESE